MKRRTPSIFAAILLALLVAGCSDGKDGESLDNGVPSGKDSAPPGKDSSAPDKDSSAPDKDSFIPGKDIFTSGKDGFVPSTDIILVQPCTPNSVFCAGNRIHKCKKDGKSSQVQQDCQGMSFPGVNYTCMKCSTGALACDPGSKVFISGSSTGPVNFNFSYRGYSTCATQKSFAEVSFKGSTFKLEVSPNGGGSWPALGLTIWNATSGQTRPLVQDVWVSVGHVVSLKVSKSGKSCHSVHNGNNPPPNKGSISLTYAGKTLGSTFKIKVSGYLVCSTPGPAKDTWEPFTFQADGIIF